MITKPLTESQIFKIFSLLDRHILAEELDFDYDEFRVKIRDGSLTIGIYAEETEILKES